MPTCKRCNGVGPAESWGRYERDGQLRKLCPECEAKGKAERGIRKCASCGATSADRSDWGRYACNGRPKVLCPDCDSKCIRERAKQRQRNEAAAAAGYERGWVSTPEYHRMQRERVASRDGRVYVPK